ncbi:uncharacterized protein TNIN_149371 [Trichonephila inaurata madagascariensis]|uniref:Uncharacterized protein n=1 Tax=Trichonephila inaurata madagascariensis TaxID=2747483 RepID=A0A8X6Y0A8_9ARAC|nr:uncharacterized protein TNIN_149371 [Trichonephila inaurata madagascariensis]
MPSLERSAFPGIKKKSKAGKFERLTELDTDFPDKRDLYPDDAFDIEAGPSGYPSITYPTFEETDFPKLIEPEKRETVNTQNETLIKTTDQSVKKSNNFNLPLLKKCFNRKKKFERLTELVTDFPDKKDFYPDDVSVLQHFHYLVSDPSGYPNITYPTFDETDFQKFIEPEKRETVNTQNETLTKTADQSEKKSNNFHLALLKKRFNRKKKIFDFYSCGDCGNYCTYSSKGFRSHCITVHKIGVQKDRTWDRFGHPFELEVEETTDTSPTSAIQLEDLDEQRQLEWALKDSAMMYAAK